MSGAQPVGSAAATTTRLKEPSRSYGIAKLKSSASLLGVAGVGSSGKSKLPSPTTRATALAPVAAAAATATHTEMYDADIDYMNTYLKSLPDYTELNKKINSEYKKCEAMYDQLQNLRRSNPLIKSNSLQCVSQYQQLMASMASAAAAGTTTTIAPTRPVAAYAAVKLAVSNKISRSTSSTTIPVRPTTTANTVKREPLVPVAAKPNGNNNTSDTSPDLLKKSSSAACINNNNKNVLNSFWSENIAKANQQRVGWNYSRIMSSTPKKPAPMPPVRMHSYEYRAHKNPAEPAASKEQAELPPKLPDKPAHMFPIQKNMSLSHLDQRARQPAITREEFYSLVCGESMAGPRAAVAAAAAAAVTSAAPLPLSKSISHTSLAPILAKPASVLSKSSSKSNIPSIFRPLCKSVSNTHVFRVPKPDADGGAATETFTPRDRLLLAKSSSSTCVPIAEHHIHAPNVPLRRHESSVAQQQRIAHNHELLQHMSGSGNSSAAVAAGPINPFVAESQAEVTGKVAHSSSRTTLLKMPSFVERFTSHAKIYPTRTAPPTPQQPAVSKTVTHSVTQPAAPVLQARLAGHQPANPLPASPNPNYFTSNSIMRSASGNLNHVLGTRPHPRPSVRQYALAHAPAAANPSYPCAGAVAIDRGAPRLTNSASFGSLNFYAHNHHHHHYDAQVNKHTAMYPLTVAAAPPQLAPFRGQMPQRQPAPPQRNYQQHLKEAAAPPSSTHPMPTTTTQSWRLAYEQQHHQQLRRQPPPPPIHYQSQCTVTSRGEVDLFWGSPNHLPLNACLVRVYSCFCVNC